MDADELFMRKAIELAKHAASLGEVPVAAIIVKNGEIIASAHNRRELDKDPTAHAEMLAIRAAAKKIKDWRLEGCTMYVTLEPCPMCAGALWLSRIERCVFGCSDSKAGFLGSVSDLNQVRELNHHYPVTQGVLADECAEILRDFFREIRARKKKEKKDKKENNDV